MSEIVVVVVAGGEPPRPEALLAVPPGARVIAADGGLDHANALGLDVGTVVGDLDSIEQSAVDGATAGGARIVRHPTDKDATDLELALDAAVELQPSRIVVLAGGGGRLDHLLANVLLLASPRYAGVEIDAEIGTAQVHVIRGERVLEAEKGDPVSLLALHGAAHGVSTEGLDYPLADETLEPGSSRGISNVFASDTARISVGEGVLVAVQPRFGEDDAK
jgi:thiamine pyrophosphokinase